MPSDDDDQITGADLHLNATPEVAEPGLGEQHRWQSPAWLPPPPSPRPT